MAYRQLKIEKGIPLPTDNAGRKGIYPWRLMQKGDSIFVPYENRETTREKDSLRCTLVNSARRQGFNVTARRLADGVRVWRVE